MRPIHYEFSLRRAHCGVRLTRAQLATNNPHEVTCEACRSTARRDIPDYDRRTGK